MDGMDGRMVGWNVFGYYRNGRNGRRRVHRHAAPPAGRGVQDAAVRAPRALAQPIARTVHILTGFTPGLQDGLARLVAGQMSGYAETIVVETRPGAAGRIAVEAVKSADADGSPWALPSSAVTNQPRDPAAFGGQVQVTAAQFGQHAKRSASRRRELDQ